MHGKIYAQYRCERTTFKVLHDDANTWAYAGALKVKYLVNAVKLTRIL